MEIFVNVYSCLLQGQTIAIGKVLKLVKEEEGQVKDIDE